MVSLSVSEGELHTGGKIVVWWGNFCGEYRKIAILRLFEKISCWMSAVLVCARWWSLHMGEGKGGQRAFRRIFILQPNPPGLPWQKSKRGKNTNSFWMAC